jgi:hypothetical protein
MTTPPLRRRAVASALCAVAVAAVVWLRRDAPPPARAPHAAADFAPPASPLHPPPMAVLPAPRDAGSENPFAAPARNPASAAPSDPRAVARALRAALAQGSSERTAALCDELAAMGPLALPALADLLACGDARAEVEAFRLLAQIGHPTGLILVLGKMLTVPGDSPDYRAFLAAFADNGSPLIADWLAAELGRAATPAARARLSDMLFSMRGEVAAEATLAAALDPVDAAHARDALLQLALRRDPSETAMLESLVRSESVELQVAAAYGLVGIGSAEACLALADAAEADATGLLARALATTASAYAQEALLSVALDVARSDAVRAAALRGLAGSPVARVQTAVRNALAQEPSGAVAEAMQALLQGGGEAPANRTFAGLERGELSF